MIAEFVARRGARLMDTRCSGSGWTRLIHRPVNIRSATDCVLGQVYGNYNWGLDTLGFGRLTACSYGFFWFNPFTRVNTLNKAWQAEIAQRQHDRARVHVLAA